MQWPIAIPQFSILANNGVTLIHRARINPTHRKSIPIFENTETGRSLRSATACPFQITLRIGITPSILSPVTIYPLFPPVQNALSSIRSQACDSTTSISFRVTVLSTASFDLLLCPWWETDEKNGRRAATLRTSRVVNLVIRKSVPRHISIWIATLGSKPVCEARDSPWWPRKIILCTPADPGCVRLFIV